MSTRETNKLAIFSILLPFIGLASLFMNARIADADIFWGCMLLAIVSGLIVLIKRKKYNKLSTIIAILGILVSIVIVMLIFVPSGRPCCVAGDAKRKSDIRQISLAMNMYYEEYGEYVEIKTTNGNIDNGSIGEYMRMIEDYRVGKKFIFFGDKRIDIPYKGFSNSWDKNKYCIYTHLDYGTFFAASHKGTKELDEAPANLDCW